VPLLEPSTGIVTHHFQFRSEETTRRQLSALYATDHGRAEQLLRSGSTDGARRFKSIDAVYAQRWKDVDNLRHLLGDVGVDPRPWSDFTPYPEPRRWYDAEALSDALAAWTRSPT
jgi:hypothetical protein